MAKRKIIDWETIEKEYRLGQKSMRNLAEQHNINASTISRRSKKFKWVQDKSKEIRQRTNATLITQQYNNTPTPEDIEVAVKTNVKIVEDHRKKLKRTKVVADILLGQLEEAATKRDEISEDIIKETTQDKTTQRRNLMFKAISLPQHSSILKDLSYSLKNIIPFERQAYNIDDRKPTGSEDDPIHVEQRHSMDTKMLTRALQPRPVGPLKLEEGG